MTAPPPPPPSAEPFTPSTSRSIGSRNCGKTRASAGPNESTRAITAVGALGAAVRTAGDGSISSATRCDTARCSRASSGMPGWHASRPTRITPVTRRRGLDTCRSDAVSTPSTIASPSPRRDGGSGASGTCRGGTRGAENREPVRLRIRLLVVALLPLGVLVRSGANAVQQRLGALLQMRRRDC
jgi:hypothetical protein